MIYFILAALSVYWQKREIPDRLDATISSAAISVAMVYTGLPTVDSPYRIIAAVVMTIIVDAGMNYLVNIKGVK